MPFTTEFTEARSLAEITVGIQPMNYESTETVESRLAKGVRFTVAKMSFRRRAELMREVRDLARRMEYLEAGPATATEKMDAALLRAEIDRLYVKWGLVEIRGLELDGVNATPEALVVKGPEDLFREAVELVRRQTGMSEEERKNY